MGDVGTTNRTLSWGDVSDNTIALYWCKTCGRFLKKYSDFEDWYEPKVVEKTLKRKKI